MKTRKILLLSAAMLLSLGASAQRPTGAWSTYEDESMIHAFPLVMYKRAADGPIYIIPAWDRRLDASSSGNGFVRVQKKASDGNGMIVTAMGLLYGTDGSVSSNGQFDNKMWVWSDIAEDWIIVDENSGEGALMKASELQYKDIYQGGQSTFIFKDSKDSYGGFNHPVQVGRKNPDYTVPSEVIWLAAQGGNKATIDEIGKFAYGNATYASSTINRSIIEKLTISTNIVKIGEYAFRGINTLEEVMIEDGGTLAAIPERCFDACWNLKKVELSSSITSIGGAAFGGCGNLNKMIFKTTTPPTFGKYNNTQDIFTTPLTNYSHSNVDATKCIIEVPLGSAKSYVNAANVNLAKFPMSSKFPMSYNMITYCSDLEFTFKQYDTSSKTWSDGSLQVYYVEDGDIKTGKVMMTEITDTKKIPSNTFGVLLRGTQNETYDIFYPNNLISPTFSPVNGNVLIGVVAPQTITPQEGSAYYVLSTDGKFHRVTAEGTLGANKAYLFDEDGGSITIDTGAMSITLPGDETGIEILLVEDEADDAVYTLQGTKVSQSHKGLVIQNGKKYIVR